MNNVEDNYYLIGNDNNIYFINKENLDVIDKIEVEERLQNIVFYNNKLYLTSDKNNIINIIENNKIIDKVYINNNGEINIDLKTKEIYICNTETIDIYNLKIEKIETIKGFKAAYKIKFNKDFSKLYVLDVLGDEIKVYNTKTKKLIKTYKDIGETPIDFYIFDNANLIYVLNKGVEGVKFLGKLVTINILNDEVDVFEFPTGSLFNNIDINNKFIFISNYGLNRIDIIDIKDMKIYKSIKSTLDIPICVKLDGENLIIVSEDNLKRCALDIVSLDNMKIEKSFNLYEKNIEVKKIYILNRNNIVENNKKYIEENNIISKNIINDKVIIKRVISECKREIVFNKLEMKVKEINSVENIEFERWEIIKDKTFKKISDEEKYVDIKFEFKIPYNIVCTTKNNERKYIRGSLSKSENIKVFLDNYKIEEVDFTIKSNTKILSKPIVSENYIHIDIISVITIYGSVEEYLSLNSYISLLEKSN